MAVRKKYPQLDYESLGMPTWLYGHEPATPFATHIAKYFDNSIREDSIVTIAMGGIVYTPGSAGTMQEIFQEAVQNHYLSFGISSPMIFLGKDYWTNEIPVWPLLQDLVARGKYKNLRLTLTDDQEEVVEVITEFRSTTEPPVTCLANAPGWAKIFWKSLAMFGILRNFVRFFTKVTDQEIIVY